MLTRVRAAVCAAPLLLSGCGGGLPPGVANFEAKAAPVIAGACADFHAAEANPLVQIAVAAGSAAASAATGGVAGPVIAELKSFGDVFCSAGPPAGDTTPPVDQALWLAAVAQQLLGAAGAI